MKRHFSESGRLTQTAVLLASEDGESSEIWAGRLRKLLDGTESPTMELITRIDALLAPQAVAPENSNAQGTLGI